MKKIFKCCGYASFDNGEWYSLGRSERLVWIEEPESLITKYILFDTFNSAYNYSKTPHPASYCNDVSIFFNRPIIWYKGVGYPYKKLTEKNFKPFAEKWQLEEVSDYTIQDLMAHMMADNFIEYCQDNGLSICPINKN